MFYIFFCFFHDNEVGGWSAVVMAEGLFVDARFFLLRHNIIYKKGV